MAVNAIIENKILAKISEFIVFTETDLGPIPSKQLPLCIRETSKQLFIIYIYL